MGFKRWKTHGMRNGNGHTQYGVVARPPGGSTAECDSSEAALGPYYAKWFDEKFEVEHAIAMLSADPPAGYEGHSYSWITF